MDDRFIKLDEDQEQRQELLQATRKPQDVLGMLSEECGELVRAAQKLRRALDADETMPFTVAKCITDFTEEASDVCLVLDMLAHYGLLDPEGVQFIGQYKADRAFWRTFKDRQVSEATKHCEFLSWMSIVDKLRAEGHAV